MEGDISTMTFQNESFTYVSLFSGIGGFEQALNKLGGKCVMASEIDKFANKAYEILYGHKTVGDVKKIAAEDVPDHDLLVGGFPCQAFSVAGKRLGFADTRGTLFFEVARIAKVKQPRVVFLENVKGLISHDEGRTLNVIIQTLSDIGYTVDFNVLNSKYFGVPQSRERIFIIAVRDDLITPEDWEIEGNNVVAKGKKRISEIEGIKTFNFDWPSQIEVTKRLKDILEVNVDEKYYISEENTEKLLSQLKNETKLKRNDIPHRLGSLYSGNHLSGSLYDANAIAPTLTAVGSNYALVKYDNPKMVGKLDISNYDMSNRVYDEDYVGPTITAQGAITKVLVRKEEKPVIRKLTPLECWRLQGFPDEAHEAVKNAGISDSQRYKMAGNAVTVNVIEAIGKRLLPYLSTDLSDNVPEPFIIENSNVSEIERFVD